MSYDGLTCAAVSNLLDSRFNGAKIDKVMMPNSLEIVLSVRTSDSRDRIVISADASGCRVAVTQIKEENPQDAPNFCMLLRKHLQGGRIVKVEQIGSERIIRFTVRNSNELAIESEKWLIAEIMGRHSNIILADPASGKILDCIKHISIDVNRVRQLLPGVSYQLPPAQEKLDFRGLEEKDFDAALENSARDGKALLTHIAGLSPAIAGYIAESPYPYQTFKMLTEKIESMELSPVVYKDEKGKPLDFYWFDYLNAGSDENLNLWDVMDDYYSHRNETSSAYQKKDALIKNISAVLDKQLLRKQRLLEDMAKAEKAEEYRIRGELLTANIGMVKPGARSVKVISYYDGSEVTIPLDEKISAAKNAQNYFKKYNKAKNSKKEKLTQLEGCNAEIDYLRSVLALIERSQGNEIEAIKAELLEQGLIRANKARDRKKPAKPQPRKFIIDGYEALVGRSNTENDYITFKLAGKTDLWFHTKDIPGSHLVLLTDGDELEAETVYKAAGIAAWFSKASDSENVPVDYVPARYVKKPGGAKPGMVIFTNNRTVWINPLNPDNL